MKKRILSILLALCMVLCLVPNTAFAEGEAEESPVCTCETACTVESMNVDCPICGAEGALPENCAKCAQPADDAAVQPSVQRLSAERKRITDNKTVYMAAIGNGSRRNLFNRQNRFICSILRAIFKKRSTNDRSMCYTISCFHSRVYN